jgi:hypothetical protein
VVAVKRTEHERGGRPTLAFDGAHLFEVTARTAEARAYAVVAADDEWQARTRLMLVQTTLKIHGQEVTFVVRQLP